MDVKQQVDELMEQIAALQLEDNISDQQIQDMVSKVKAMPFRVRLTQKLGDFLLRSERENEAIDAYLQVGRFYREHDDYAKASATFKHILKLDKQHWNARKQLAEVYLKDERVQDAVDEYRWISRYFYNQGDLESSAQYRYKITEILPDSIVHHVKLGEIFVEMGQTDDAVAQFEQALELLEDQGYWRDLIKVAERLLYLSPNHLYTLKLIARIHLENNNAMKSLAHLRHALQQAPEDPEVLKLLTIAFDKIEQPKKTISVLHKLAGVYQDREQLALAREAYTEILQRDPGDKVSRESLASLTAMSTADITESVLSATDIRPPEKRVSRGGLISLERTEEIYQHLEHCNVRVEQISSHLLEKIEHRAAPPGRKLSQWPDVIRRQVDGEILYDHQYLLLDVLRRDVFGIMYRAVDINHPSYYVCILRPNFSEQLTPEKQELVDEWKERVNAVLDFSHPHLLSVLGGGYTEAGHPYLVTEYFDAEPLTTLRDALSPLQLFELFYQLTHTIDYLHSRGVLHGNLSPSYVLKSHMGDIKVDGFALMSLLGTHVEAPNVDAIESDSTPPSEQVSVVSLPLFTGTPGFIAPEMLQGQPISRQSDVFSLGCVLYFMAQHKRPPWSVERQIGNLVYSGITRSKDDPVPSLELGEAPHVKFLEKLLAQMVTYLPQTRISLREVQAKHAAFTQRDDHPLYRSTEAGNTNTYFPPNLLSTPSGRLVGEVDVRLPDACLELPVAIQQKLQQLLARIEQLHWFQPQKDAKERGIEHLKTFIQRISPFASAPLMPQISFVRTRWLTLQQQLVQASQLEAIVKETVSESLIDNPNSWALAGKSAWDAIHSYKIPEGHLLSYDTANAAVSSSAWSAAWNPVWASARTSAWNTAKAISKASGRTTAWNAAKTAAWTAAWPVAKAIAPPEMRTSARTAASDTSWTAAWLVASDQLSDQPNPFEPLFAIWELGLYPMLLFDGNYILVAIDGTVGDAFEVELSKSDSRD